MYDFDIINVYAPEILEAKEVIKFKAGLIRHGEHYSRAIEVTMKNINNVILQHTYIFAYSEDWFEMIDELSMLTPVFEKDMFYEETKVQYSEPLPLPIAIYRSRIIKIEG